jgi:effector-binding domain-containing protein
MEVIEVKPINFLFHRAETTIDQLYIFAPITQEIYREAISLGLAVTGAIHWHYFGLTGMEKPFVLEVSLPVEKVIDGYDGKFHFKRTGIYKAVSAMHYGGWDKIVTTKVQMFDFMKKKQLTAAGVDREIYINIDFSEPDANITELQIGIV